MKKYSLLVLVLLLSALFTLPAYANTQDSQGDINRDHIVNADDALAVLKHVAILDTMGSSEMRRADVNRDQTIDAKDALNVLKYAVGLINTYDEYIKCIKSLEDKAIDDYSVVSHYDEKYFEENVLVVANYVDSSHSIESSYLNTTNYEDRFVVNIEQMNGMYLFHWKARNGMKRKRELTTKRKVDGMLYAEQRPCGCLHISLRGMVWSNCLSTVLFLLMKSTKTIQIL